MAFAVGAALKVLGVILDEEATALAGPKGVHDRDRTAVRHGTEDGLVALGCSQVSIRRPRLRSADRTSEVALPTYRALHVDRGPGPRDLDSHDGQAVHPALSRRSGAGGHGGRGGQPLHVEIGRVAALRGRHRDRPW